MSRKNMNEFKNKLKENNGEKIPSKAEEKTLSEKIYIRIEKINEYLSYKEAESVVRDVLELKKNLKKNDILRLSEVCDMICDLRYTGSKTSENKKELFFSIVDNNWIEAYNKNIIEN